MATRSTPFIDSNVVFYEIVTEQASKIAELKRK